MAVIVGCVFALDVRQYPKTVKLPPNVELKSVAVVYKYYGCSGPTPAKQNPSHFPGFTEVCSDPTLSPVA